VSVHVFGVRHHGPGSARSLEAALGALKPDCVLIEGPPDADGVIEFAGSLEMKPPVALLVYASDDPSRSVFYPFASFSPEWVAIRFALHKRVPVRFMDLPQAHQLLPDGPEADAEPTLEADPATPSESAATVQVDDPAMDPLGFLARVAGFSDGERYWEFLVESRGGTQEVFPGILEAMRALRDESLRLAGQRLEASSADAVRESRREAFMRQTIREAIAAGHERIAVVCGAWHAPMLEVTNAAVPSAKDDAATLKGLDKAKVTATWVPWSHGLLARSSGYGAGVDSPGWYAHLFDHAHLDSQGVTVNWMARVARLLRGKDLDASSASVIESVRLAEGLAAMRGLPLPGLQEVSESARALFCWDSDAPMQLIHRELILNEALGSVPPETPAVPLQRDFEATVKSLRLKLDAGVQDIDLDLREASGLAKSQFLHRLALLGVKWGAFSGNKGTGTFREAWQLKWEPAFSVRLVEVSRYGATVEGAAQNFAMEIARGSTTLPELSGLLDAVMLAALPEATDEILRKLEALSASSSDVAHLCGALPPLVRVARYGNVRQTDASTVRRVITTLVTRVVIGFPGACSSLNDDAADAMYTHLLATHNAIQTLEDAAHRTSWLGMLEGLVHKRGLHGLIAGRAARLLLEAGTFSNDDTARELGLAASRAGSPDVVAAWVDGFLRDSGAILVHDDALFAVLDSWIAGLTGDDFQAIVPLLRRTFSTFEAPERRNIGEKARAGGSSVTRASNVGDVDATRGELVLPLLRQMLGLA
jgi:Family of unknown function (DUF5682)